MNAYGELHLEDGEYIPDPLPLGLTSLRVRGSPSLVMPILPFTVTYVSVTHGQLASMGETKWGLLEALETMDLSHNALRDVDIAMPPTLATLMMKYNPLASFQLRRRTATAAAKVGENENENGTGDQLVTLDLEGCRLTGLPACLRSHPGGRLPALNDLRLKHNPIWYLEYSDIAPSRVTLAIMEELADAEAYGTLEPAHMRRARYHLRDKARAGEIDADLALPWHVDIDAAEAAEAAARPLRDHNHNHDDDFDGDVEPINVPLLTAWRPVATRLQALRTTHNNAQNVHVSSNQAALTNSIRTLRTMRAERQRAKADATDVALVAEFVEWHLQANGTPMSGNPRSRDRGLNGFDVSTWCGNRRRGGTHGTRLLPPWVTRMHEACADLTRHSTLGVRYVDMLGLVLSAARASSAKDDLFAVLKDEIVAGQGLCFTGRVSRLVNALGGFIEGVGIHLSRADEIANAIVVIRARNADQLGEDTDPYLAKTIADVHAMLAEGHADMTPEACEAYINAL